MNPELVSIMKALADENRLRILSLLRDGEVCVCKIEQALSLTQSNVSRHLNKLKTAGMVLTRKDAQWVYYRSNPDVLDRYPFLTSLWEHLEQVSPPASCASKRRK